MGRLGLYIATPPVTVPPNEWGSSDDVGSVARVLTSMGLDTKAVAVSNPGALDRIPRGAFVIPNGRFVPGSPSRPLLMELLEERSLPYLGSGPAAMRTAFDKGHLKEALGAAGIPTPKYTVFDRPDASVPTVPAPCVVKLTRGSESIGTAVATTPSDAGRIASGLVAEYRQPVVIEEYIGGREFTVALIGNRSKMRAIPVEMRRPPDRPILDSTLKEGSLHDLVAPIDERDTRERLCALALAVGEALDLRDWARIDVLEGTDSLLYAVDVNTLPGLRRSPQNPSLLPYMVRLSLGSDYETLVAGLVGIALDRYGIPRPPDIEAARLRLIH